MGVISPSSALQTYRGGEINERVVHWSTQFTACAANDDNKLLRS